MNAKTTNAQEGQPAPDFTLRDGVGAEWRLADHRGKVVVLLFYPGDETPVCTRQLCSVRDRWEDYAADNHSLPLRLLSDSGAEVAKLYDAKSVFPGRVARSVFVIDADGIIRYRDVRRVGFLRPKDDVIIRAIRAAQ
jgi:peroxiredoxin Q/BCP